MSSSIASFLCSEKLQEWEKRLPKDGSSLIGSGFSGECYIWLRNKKMRNASDWSPDKWISSVNIVATSTINPSSGDLWVALASTQCKSSIYFDPETYVIRGYCFRGSVVYLRNELKIPEEDRPPSLSSLIDLFEKYISSISS